MNSAQPLGADRRSEVGELEVGVIQRQLGEDRLVVAQGLFCRPPLDLLPAVVARDLEAKWGRPVGAVPARPRASCAPRRQGSSRSRCPLRCDQRLYGLEEPRQVIDLDRDSLLRRMQLVLVVGDEDAEVCVAPTVEAVKARSDLGVAVLREREIWAAG
jgi:hypothetical protein